MAEGGRLVCLMYGIAGRAGRDGRKEGGNEGSWEGKKERRKEGRNGGKEGIEEERWKGMK